MADQPLKGQRALVTGASSGIGLGVAKALGAAGADVVVNYVSAPEAAEAAAEIRGGGSRAMAIRADVSREDQVQAMFREMLAAWGGIDILVNNAGLQKDAAFGEMTLAQWNTVIGVNLTGMFLCSREAVRDMTRRGVRPEVSRAAGKILCVSSVHEVIPWAGHANYAASKGGVKLFMQTLAQELAPARIRVNSIAPGAIQTPINRSAWETPQALKSLLNLIPYGRIGQPEDIGRVAVFLASDDADYINGQTIFVDGGMTLYPEFAHGGLGHALRHRDHRHRGGRRHAAARARPERQADPGPRARRLRAAREGELEHAGGQPRGALPDQGGLARPRWPAAPPTHQLLRGRQHQVLRRRALPAAARGLRRDQALGRCLAGVADRLR